MKESKVLKVILFISGLVAIGIGGVILTIPGSFYASSGIELYGNASLLSEIRASGGLITVVGLIIMAGVFIPGMMYTSTVISMLLYLTYGFSRMLSIVIDGMPVEALVQALVLEIVIGGLCVFAYFKYRINNPVR